MSAATHQPDDDLESLDFTSYVPPPEPSPEPPPPAAPTALERAERLYVEGQTMQAAALLNEALRAGDPAAIGAERAWTLLLACCQALGRREAFEACALEYAARFEKSPPAWVAAAGAGTATDAGKPTSASLAGTLNARVEGPLQQILKVCAQRPVRIDLSRIASVDDAGCALLVHALAECRRHSHDCRLAGAGQLANLLAGLTKVGERRDEHAWLLLLELLQRLGRQEAFEAAALDYAVTFEVSPPSWEAARVGGCDD